MTKIDWASVQEHPAAQMFPMMLDDELDELAADIKENGLLHPVVMWSDNNDQKSPIDCSGWPLFVLDGRNRLEALRRLGLTPETAKMAPMAGTSATKWLSARRVVSSMAGGASNTPETDPWVYSVSANARRRHLSTVQKQEAIATLLKRAAPGTSNREIARAVGVSHHTVGKVRDAMADEQGATVGKLPTVAPSQATLVAAAVAAEPDKPVRQVARELGVPRQAVQRAKAVDPAKKALDALNKATKVAAKVATALDKAIKLCKPAMVALDRIVAAEMTDEERAEVRKMLLAKLDEI